MIFNIKEKLLLLINKDYLDNKYTYEIKEKIFALWIVSTTISATILSIYFIEIIHWVSINTIIGSIGLSIFIIALTSTIASIMAAIVFISNSIRKKENFFKKYKNRLNIEKEMDGVFGSVDNAINIYKEISQLNIEFSDENFYKILNENDSTLNKRTKIQNIEDKKLEKIQERINKLIKEKELITSKSNEKQGEVLNKIKTIEYKGVDMSMDLSELKERVVAGGLS